MHGSCVTLNKLDNDIDTTNINKVMLSSIENEKTIGIDRKKNKHLMMTEPMDLCEEREELTCRHELTPACSLT